MAQIPDYIRKKIFERDNFSCQKCDFKDINCEELEVHHIQAKIDRGDEELANLITLCSICHHYAPDYIENFENYINEKIDGTILETFRKSRRSTSAKTIKGMQKNFLEGKHITKAPKGYKLLNKQMIVNKEESAKVNAIFEEFLNSNISLTQLAKKNNMTTSGIIKLLSNTTYLGKVKFANQESEGQHEPIIDKLLFEQVQNKLNPV